MANFFYYDNSGIKQGPVSREELQTLAVQLKINPQTRLETEGGHSGAASQIPGLFPSPNPFGSRQNFNAQQVSQAADKAYTVTKTFAENSAWKTILFRIAQLLVLVGEVIFIGMLTSDKNELGYFMGRVENPLWIFIQITAVSVVISAVLIAVLEAAINTGKMLDYMNKE